MSESELALATTLQKEGVLEDAIAHAQERGLSLLDFIKDCCRGTLLRVDPSMHRSDAVGVYAPIITSTAKTPRSVEAIWEDMMSQPWEVRYAGLCEVCREGGFEDLTREEIRDLCND